MTTRITSENITDATITSTDLAAGAGSTDWQAVITADGSTVTTMVSGRGYFVNTTSAAGILKFPASASRGDYVEIKDYARTFGTNNVTIQRNSHNVDGTASDATLSTTGTGVKFVYMDSTRGWSAVNDDGTAQYGATFISATGGTVSTSGNFKIHTFTGDSNFVVASLGNPAGGGAIVDYMVVAGGGGATGASGSGAGAGGFRASNDTCMPAPLTSPLANPTGLTVAAQSYPITVGAGGAGTVQPSKGASGSVSTFSTITSAGGGGGAFGGSTPGGTGLNGGSGSGGGGEYPGSTGPAGSGNTPPVSPPQGNNGGTGGQAPAARGSGGGGGAGAAGENASGSGGDGGTGSYMIQTGFAGCHGTPGPVGSTRYFAGGGGGGFEAAGGHNGDGGSGGGGGGGPGGSNPGDGRAATANTGGGGGGGSRGQPGSNACQSGAAGGKGIVIIRYKFQ